MKNWTIGKRIIIGGASLLALLLVVGTTSVIALRELKGIAETRIRDRAIPGIVSFADIGTLSLRSHINILMASRATSVTDLDNYLAAMAQNVKAIDDAMKAYEPTLTKK